MSRDDESMQIIKRLVVDGFILIGLFLSVLASNLAWVPYHRGFFCGDESLMYPYMSDTVTVPVLRGVGLGLPILAFLICEWCILRKETEYQRLLGVRIPTWIRGFYCVLISFLIGCCFTELLINIAKGTIGRFRPHYFHVCQPSIDCSLSQWQGRYIQSHEYTCTGPDTAKFTEMRKSFLSGHSAWAAFTMVYLALYLHRRMQWKVTRSLSYTLQFSAVMLSWFCALSRVSDYKHHWSDVLAGYLAGIILAVIVFLWGTELIARKTSLQLNKDRLNHHDITVLHQQVTSGTA